jgi:hypothetical protein
MAELLSSPWFEGLNSASQGAVAVLAIIVFGSGTFTVARTAWNVLRKGQMPWQTAKPAAVPTAPSSLTLRFLRLLSDPDWDVARDEKESTLLLIHRSLTFSVTFNNDLMPVRYEANKIDVEGRLSDTDRERLDHAAEQRLDLVLADAPPTGGTSKMAAQMVKPGV